MVVQGLVLVEIRLHPDDARSLWTHFHEELWGYTLLPLAEGAIEDDPFLGRVVGCL